jgi:ankyrin repeat protein
VEVTMMHCKAHRIRGWWSIALLAVASVASAADDLRLVAAAKGQDFQAMRTLLAQKVGVDGSQPDGTTALHWAVHWDNLDAVDLLIRSGASVNTANDYGVTPLLLACTNANAAVLDSLLRAGANPNTASGAGETPLMKAASTGSVDAVKLLLGRGAQVNATEPARGQVALMWATAEGHLDVPRLLIEHGADVHARSKAGFTPLLFAARTGNVDLVRLLLGAGADVNEASKNGTTALVTATVRSEVKLAKFLLEQGADPNNGPGFLPLHWAAGEWSERDYSNPPKAEGHEWSALEGLSGPDKVEMVQLLLAHGANPNARAEGNPPRYGSGRARGGLLDGATPFLIAARIGDTAVMRLLVAAGADPLLATTQGATPLHVAAGVGIRGRTEVLEADAFAGVKLSVELGNDVNAVDDWGETPLHAAMFRGPDGSDSIIHFLVENGAKLNAKDKYGYTPLTIAEGLYYGGSDTRSDKTAELLRKLGAEPTPPDIERDVYVAAIKVGLKEINLR